MFDCFPGDLLQFWNAGMTLPLHQKLVLQATLWCGVIVGIIRNQSSLSKGHNSA